MQPCINLGCMMAERKPDWIPTNHTLISGKVLQASIESKENLLSIRRNDLVSKSRVSVLLLWKSKKIHHNSWRTLIPKSEQNFHQSTIKKCVQNWRLHDSDNVFNQELAGTQTDDSTFYTTKARTLWDYREHTWMTSRMPESAAAKRTGAET